MTYTKDFLDIHNDDLTPVNTIADVTYYVIDYDKAEARMNEYIQKLIEVGKKAEFGGK